MEDFDPAVSFTQWFASSERHPVLGKGKRGGVSSIVVSF